MSTPLLVLVGPPASGKTTVGTALADVLGAGGFPRVPDLPTTPGGPSREGGVDTHEQRLHQNADPGQSLDLYLRVRDGGSWTGALRLRDSLRADPSGAHDDVEL